MAKEQDTVNDKWVFWGLYPAIALLAVHIGNANTFAQLLKIPSYYTDVLFSLLATYAIGFYLKKLHHRLYALSLSPNTLFWRRLLLGMVVPLVFSIGAEIIYLLAFLKIPLSNSSIFYLEMPLAIILLLGINLLYVVLYAQKNNSKLQMLLAQQTTTTAPQKQNIVVRSGAKAINISLQEVAYFFVSEKTTFLVTTANAQYVSDESLEGLEKKLPPTIFYKLNRQVITSRQAVQESVQTETRRLLVKLHPAPPYLVYVSKVKATDFLKWLSD